MGFLSRRQKKDFHQTTNGGPPPVAEQLERVEQEVFEPEPEEAEAVDQHPPEPETPEAEAEAAVEPAPEPETPSDHPTPDPVASGVVDEHATGIDVSERGEGSGAEVRPEPSEDRRMKASDLLTPLRPHGGPSDTDDGSEVKRAQVFVFANQKGGVAKTTSTLNLAVAFSESGHRVLCIDLDPQGNLTMSQGIDPDKLDKSMFDVLVHDMPIREVIHQREIDIAVASIDLAGAEIAMSTKIGRERSLEKALDKVAGDYDFICIDTPPSLGLLTINALTAANKVIVPVQCEYLSMRGLVQLQNTLKMIQENLNPDVEIEGILPTMLDARTVHAKEAVEILEENFGELVFKSRIRKAIKFAEAPVRGSSVLKYDPDGNAAHYYRELAKEVLTNGAS
jgi:chromosome partitioning protein